MAISLDNLVGVSLERVEPDVSVIRRLIAAAERNIADSHLVEVSSENRFDAAYKAIMQLSNTALQANGFRTLTMCGRFANHVTAMHDWAAILRDWPAGIVTGFNVVPSQMIAAFTFIAQLRACCFARPGCRR